MHREVVACAKALQLRTLWRNPRLAGDACGVGHRGSRQAHKVAACAKASRAAAVAAGPRGRSLLRP
ncbi:conserved hypothetical protein [Ricinus communis]|uniref:Uncharacterized protein n=1 Tax=Ricinus communis TaxID=3988 RepID=B9T547_RICCO|nr:conserved hypothetical protein [Ricinus communis]